MHVHTNDCGHANFELPSSHSVPLMPSGPTIRQIFQAAGLTPHGPVRWLDGVDERRPGVYAVAIVPDPDDHCPPVGIAYLPDEIRVRWTKHPLIYIGRTKLPLSRRINEFYRHVHGARSPHRGGQDVKLLKCSLWVYWCPTNSWAEGEDKMIEYFRNQVGPMPFANRVRSARVNNNSRFNSGRPQAQ
jgi:hypothetical protein